MKVLLNTIHGSHLYGLANESSDTDFYRVVEESKSKQTIIDGVDTTTFSYDTFMSLCFKGVPQALEAMFSQRADVDEIPFIRNNFRAAGSSVVDTYMRTIFALAMDERHAVKYRRHAVRLTLNLNDVLRYGRFDPALNAEQKFLAISLSHLPLDDFKVELNSVGLIDVFKS